MAAKPCLNGDAESEDEQRQFPDSHFFGFAGFCFGSIFSDQPDFLNEGGMRLKPILSMSPLLSWNVLRCLTAEREREREREREKE